MGPVSAIYPVIALAFALGTTFLISKIVPLKLTPVQFVPIDGLRGYLAFFVFMHHSAIWYFFLHANKWELPPSNLYIHFGQSSVALFFMITGFLFFDILINGKSKPIDWLRLFVSRIMRLTPIYLMAMFFMIIIVVILTDFSFHESVLKVFEETAAWLLYTIPGTPEINGLINTWRITAGVTWSLVYEWLFYLSLPLMALIFLRLKSSVPVLISASAVVLIIIWLKAPFFIHCISFSGGIVSAFLVRSQKFRDVVSKKIISFFILLCLFSAVAFYATSHSFFPLLLISLAFVSIAGGNTLFGVLNHSLSRIFGKLAYSIYLLHGMVLFVTFRFVVGFTKASVLSAMEHWFIIFCTIVPLIMISYFAHIFIELPGMNSTLTITKRMRDLFYNRTLKLKNPK